MEQRISTLDLPNYLINNLKNVGKNYRVDLSNENDLKLIDKNSQKNNSVNTLNGFDYLIEELTNSSILSLNKELDLVLIDEICPGRIVEFTGLSGSGKTQICLQLCVTAQLPKKFGGLNGQVIYINTMKNFSITRLKELSEKILNQIKKNHYFNMSEINQLNEEYILKNIFVFNLSEVVEILAAAHLLKSSYLKEKNIKLLIIDSITQPLRIIPDYLDKRMLTNTILELFQSLAVKFKFAIVLTNDYLTKIVNNKIIQVPSLGDGFFDRINTRINLRKKYSSDENSYFAELVKSSIKPPVIMCNFCLL